MAGNSWEDWFHHPWRSLRRWYRRTRERLRLQFVVRARENPVIIVPLALFAFGLAWAIGLSIDGLRLFWERLDHDMGEKDAASEYLVILGFVQIVIVTAATLVAAAWQVLPIRQEHRSSQRLVHWELEKSLTDLIDHCGRSDKALPRYVADLTRPNADLRALVGQLVSMKLSVLMPNLPRALPPEEIDALQSLISQVEKHNTALAEIIPSESAALLPIADYQRKLNELLQAVQAIQYAAEQLQVECKAHLPTKS